MNTWRPASRQAGFTFVEIIIALGLAAILIPALGRALSFSLRVAAQGEMFSQATALAAEEMEAIYYIKGNDSTNWTWTAASPTSGVYQPSTSGAAWVLGVPVVTLVVSPAPFTRAVTIFSVNRDVNGNINPGGTLDVNTRLVHVVVSWPEATGTQQVTLDSYVTNH